MDNPSQKTIELMRALAKKAERDESFMAYALRQYMELECIGKEELGKRLCLSEHGLLRLSLCRRPDVDSPDFRRDVQRCAEVSGADQAALANILRAVRCSEIMATASMVAARALDVSGFGERSAGAPSEGAEGEKKTGRSLREEPEGPEKPEKPKNEGNVLS